MTVPVSYRLDEGLKRRLSEQAAVEGVTETGLVARILDEALKVAAHPGIVYRDGPTGRRAALAAGPDVWEVINGVRHARGRGEKRIGNAAEQMGLPERLVRLAVNFAAAYPDEIEERIAMNAAAAERARALAEERERLLAS
ncbi:MAG: hypothetical protein KY469_19220 [Actinobacteria bacterium]|nr:hypothetical protein [Actinomycetota bacterium]